MRLRIGIGAHPAVRVGIGTLIVAALGGIAAISYRDDPHPVGPVSSATAAAQDAGKAPVEDEDRSPSLHPPTGKLASLTCAQAATIVKEVNTELAFVPVRPFERGDGQRGARLGRSARPLGSVAGRGAVGSDRRRSGRAARRDRRKARRARARSASARSSRRGSTRSALATTRASPTRPETKNARSRTRSTWPHATAASRRSPRWA